MALRSKFQILAGVLFLIALAWCSWYILDVTEVHPNIPETGPVRGTPKVVFGILLMLCMILGMVANYLWDLFNDDKHWDDITWRGIAMPILVSPMVFFGIWSLWKGDPLSFALPLISFQNGFFWRVIFSKAGPK